MIFNFLTGNVTKRTLLLLVVPLMFVFQYGVLPIAIRLYPRPYVWHSMTISRLLSPRSNPEFYRIPSIGIVMLGVLMVPFAGYIGRRLRAASPVAAKLGAVCFAGGAICLILTALISSHPPSEGSGVPNLHTVLAWSATLGTGLGVVVFYVGGLKGCLHRQVQPKLFVGWSFVVIPLVVVVPLRLIIAAHFQFLASFRAMLEGSIAGHRGFWEWTWLTALFVFLACSAALLPSAPNPVSGRE